MQKKKFSFDLRDDVKKGASAPFFLGIKRLRVRVIAYLQKYVVEAMNNG